MKVVPLSQGVQKNITAMRRYTTLFWVKAVALLALQFGFAALQPSKGCTSAVVSGKATPDGKPLLWKLRDTDNLKNRLQYYNDGKYGYVALVNSDSTAATMVWAGCNSAGFAIMNTASFNTNAGDTTKFADQEGVVMKEALMECATLADFEAFLNRRPKPWGLNANFGAIDAQGGAAYYEADNNRFVKFDANDPHVAPHGFLVRTNYTYTGTPNVGYGFIRYATAERIISDAQARGAISRSLFSDRLARDLSNSLTGDDQNWAVSAKRSGDMKNASDFLCRYGSASNIVIEGVRRGEDPAGSVVWAAIAFPLTCVTVPAWPSLGGVLPSCAAARRGGEEADLSRWALKGMAKIYPINRGSGLRYMDLAAYRNAIDGGIAPRVEKMEREVEARSVAMSRGWKGEVPVKRDVEDFYKWLDDFLQKEYTFLK